MKRFLTWGLLGMVALSVWPNTAKAEDFIKIKGLYWNSRLSGKIKADTKTAIGSSINLRKDLDLEKYVKVPEVEFKFKVLGSGKIIVSYWSATYKGDNRFAQPITYKGIIYDINEYVKTELSLKMTTLLYEWTFVPESLSRAFPSLAEAECGLLFGVKYIEAESSLTSATQGVTKEDFGFPIPTVGLFFQVDIVKKVRLELSATGVSASTSEFKARFLDAYSEIKVDLVKGIPLGLGYKLTDFDLKTNNHNDFTAEFRLEGPYIFVTVGF